MASTPGRRCERGNLTLERLSWARGMGLETKEAARRLPRSKSEGCPTGRLQRANVWWMLSKSGSQAGLKRHHKPVRCRLLKLFNIQSACMYSNVARRMHAGRAPGLGVGHGIDVGGGGGAGPRMFCAEEGLACVHDRLPQHMVKPNRSPLVHIFGTSFRPSQVATSHEPGRRGTSSKRTTNLAELGYRLPLPFPPAS